jgi:hypothetical protein
VKIKTHAYSQMEGRHELFTQRGVVARPPRTARRQLLLR